jgi:parallel beta-helix repeat protein
MASIGTIVSIDKKSNPRTMRVQIEAQYPVDAQTQIIALSPWMPSFDSLFGFYGVTHFQSLSHPKLGLQINFTDKAPQNATQIGDLARVSARFVIRNNTFSYNRARGILLESSFGLVEQNTFTGQTAQGIFVGVASGSEGPGVQNVIFRGNHFSNVGSF